MEETELQIGIEREAVVGLLKQEKPSLDVKAHDSSAKESEITDEENLSGATSGSDKDNAASLPSAVKTPEELRWRTALEA